VVTSRLVIDHLRKKPPFHISLDSCGKENYGQGNKALKIPDSRPPPLELLQEKETLIFLDELLEELKPRERLAMQLRFKDGLSGEKTATLLKMNRNHLNQIIHRVKKSLRQKAEEKGFL
jgi:RNA polymerase sigma factor (sigma-70 family)